MVAGAPGIVVAAADYLDEDCCSPAPSSSRQAGPPTQRREGICHGTAGNGYALLAAFERTGDEEWPSGRRSPRMRSARSSEARGAIRS